MKLIVSQTIPDLPNSFRYNSEVIYRHKNEEGVELDVVAPKKVSKLAIYEG